MHGSAEFFDAYYKTNFFSESCLNDLFRDMSVLTKIYTLQYRIFHNRTIREL